MSIIELALKGRHNVYNSMAAGIAARVLEVRKDVVRESLSDFQNVEHRLERVANVNGVDFINDSKATNVNSTWYALESMDKPVIWVVGGVDKGNDYSTPAGPGEAEGEGHRVPGDRQRQDAQGLRSCGARIMVDTRSAEQAVHAAYAWPNPVMWCC
jgi:UDP-N-acetylmuramoylalanine--D-glutamate ligase